jgi:hypothetical protein
MELMRLFPVVRRFLGWRSPRESLRHQLGVTPRNILRTAREFCRSGTGGVAMNDIQSAGKLLEQLREAYRSLPQHIRKHVAYLLRESILQKQPDKCAS